MEDKLDLEEAARLLGLSEATVFRWVRQGRIPALRERGRCFFMEKHLRSWAQKHHIPLKEGRPPPTKNPAEEGIRLSDAIRRGGVFFGVKGRSVEAVLEEAVKRVPLSDDFDKASLLEHLLQREELASTGIGEGVAIPHPRSPLELLPGKAMVTPCFLEQEVDFRSIDKKPVFLVCLILCATTQLHLKILSQLSFCLRNEAFLSFLKGCQSADELLKRVAELEDRFQTG